MRAEIAVEWEPIREEWVNQFLASQWGGDVAHLITSSMNSISESGQDVYTYALQMSNMSETLRGMDDLLQALTILGDQGAQSLIDLVQHPALVNILLSSQGSPDGLYTQILSNPALIQELASSPLMPQVLTEVFRSELIQETLVSELFGDIEAEDSPIRTALASALGDLASDDNPIAQALINGILSGGEEEGASLGGAVRQIVQDTLRGTDETAVLPTLDRIDLRLNETEISLQQQNALIRMLEARANGVDARLRSLEGRVSQLGHTPAGADNNNIRRDPDTGMANLRNNPR